MNKKTIISIVTCLLVAVLLVSWVAYEIKTGTKATEITVEEAQKIVNKQFDDIAIGIPVQYIADKNEITVNKISYGDEKNIILECTVKTLDSYKAISSEYGNFLSSGAKKENGTMFKSTLDYQMEFEDGLVELLKTADLVKFAKYQTTLSENDKNLVSIVEFVSSTQQEDPEEKPIVIEQNVEEKKQKQIRMIQYTATAALSLVIVLTTIYLIKEILYTYF